MGEFLPHIAGDLPSEEGDVLSKIAKNDNQAIAEALRAEAAEYDIEDAHYDPDQYGIIAKYASNLARKDPAKENVIEINSFDQGKLLMFMVAMKNINASLNSTIDHIKKTHNRGLPLANASLKQYSALASNTQQHISRISKLLRRRQSKSTTFVSMAAKKTGGSTRQR